MRKVKIIVLGHDLAEELTRGKVARLRESLYLLDGVVASKVVHHVALGAEALAAALRALERPVVVVDPHVHLQVVPVVERFAAG